MKQKKILMITYHWPPEGTQSGVLRNLKFAKYLPLNGWQPVVLTASENTFEVLDTSLLKHVPSGIKVFRTMAFNAKKNFSVAGKYPSFLEIPDRYASWIPFAVNRALKIIEEEEIDAIYSSSPPATVHLIALVTKKIAGLPWIADFRDPWVDFLDEGKDIASLISRRMEKIVVENADKLALTTTALRERFIERYPKIDSEKFVVIENGFDEDDFKEIKLQKEKGKGFTVMHAGSLNSTFRNPAPFIRAFNEIVASGKIENANAVFIGAGAGFSGPNVEITERLQFKKCLSRLAKADCLLLLQESLDTACLIPSKLFEYARLGKPLLCIAPKNSETSKLVEGLGAGITVEPNNAEGIKKAILDIYSRKFKTRLRLGQLKRFNRSELTKKLAALLDNIVMERNHNGKN